MSSIHDVKWVELGTYEDNIKARSHQDRRDNDKHELHNVRPSFISTLGRDDPRYEA
jgi:hypothetical protein